MEFWTWQSLPRSIRLVPSLPRNPPTRRVCRQYDLLRLPFNEGVVRNLNWKNSFSTGNTFWNTQPLQMRFRNPPVVKGISARNMFFEKVLGTVQSVNPVFITTSIFSRHIRCNEFAKDMFVVYNENILIRTMSSPSASKSGCIGPGLSYEPTKNQELVDYHLAIENSCQTYQNARNRIESTNVNHSS